MSAQGKTTGAIDRVTHFIRTISWADLQPAVQTKAVACLLDSFGATLVGATLVGARTKVAEIADTCAREHLKGDGASTLGFDEHGSWVEDIGSTYLLPVGIQWKRYSCFGWNDPTLHATESSSDRLNLEVSSWNA